MLIAPSLLSANFSNMAGGISTIEESGAHWIHLDVMDGSFVPNLTFGYKMVADLRPRSELPFDVHLMVVHPETFIESFAASGADYITIHAEATVHLHRVLGQIRTAGKRPGISIVPSTPLVQISELLPYVDLILIMTVNPGFGGQEIIDSCLDKVRALRNLKEEKGYNYLIEVDGGVNRETCRAAIDSGAEVLVVGSAFFNDGDPRDLVTHFKEVNQGLQSPPG